MYTEQDHIEIRQRIKKYSLILAAVMVVLLAGYAATMIIGNQLLAMVMGTVVVCAFLFIVLMFLYPCVRYNGFLKQMRTGLSRELRCKIVSVSEKEELQDGARVYQVIVFLTEEQDERIVYLNVSKADMFPEVGTEVKLSCCGRHIKEVVVA